MTDIAQITQLARSILSDSNRTLGVDEAISEAVDAFKALDSQFEDDELDIEVKCQPNDCRITGSLVLLEIKAGINMAKAFGVVP